MEFIILLKQTKTIIIRKYDGSPQMDHPEVFQQSTNLGIGWHLIRGLIM